MKKILFIISLIFILSACSDSDDGYKKVALQEMKQPIIEINSNIDNEKKDSLFINVGISEFKKELSKNDGIVIDLRTTRELEESGIIKGAKQIDFYSRNFKEKLNKLDKNKKYLIYCRSGGRSSQAMGIMSDLGFKNVVELRGGMNAWLQNGEKTIQFMGDNNMMNNEELMMNTSMKNKEEKIVRLNASKWKFDKTLLTFKKGEKVKIKINNTDVLHGITIPEMRLMGDNEIELDTSKVGTYEFKCLNYCGEGHRDMGGTIVIE